jgi:hypothetical protein
MSSDQLISLIGTQVTQFTMPLVAVLTLNVSVSQLGVLNALLAQGTALNLFFGHPGFLAGLFARVPADRDACSPQGW